MNSKKILGRLFLVLYSVYVFIYILNTSLLDMGMVMTLTNYSISSALILMFFLKQRYSVKELFVYGVLVVAFFLAAMTSGNTKILIIASFLLCADCVRFRSISRASLIVTGISTIIVVLLCSVGILEDYVYSRSSDAIGHSLGFTHYSTLPYYLFFMWLNYLYLRRTKLSFLELLFWLAIEGIVYYFTTLRLTLVLVVFVELIYILCVKYNVFKIYKRWIRRVSKVAFPVFGLGSILMAYFYSTGNSVLIAINTVLSGRLSLGSRAFRMYSLSLFGQPIEMVGSTEVTYGGRSRADYFFLDSGYVYSLFAYGILFTIIALIIYAYLHDYSCVTNNTMLFVWITAVMFFTISNNRWLDIAINPVILYFPTALQHMKTIGKKRRKRRGLAIRL